MLTHNFHKIYIVDSLYKSVTSIFMVNNHKSVVGFDLNFFDDRSAERILRWFPYSVHKYPSISMVNTLFAFGTARKK